MITPPALFSTRWRPGWLLGGHLFALMLLLSYALPSGHQLWQAAGADLFYWLNGSLAGNGGWTWFWAWMNSRELDAASALLMLAFLVFPLALERRQLQAATCGFLTLMLLMLPARELLSEATEAWGLSGNSPSLELQPAHLFAELRPEIPAKDRSTSSFPGDHATVTLIWCGFLLYNSRRWLSGALISGIALLLILPRLIGGAHWLSDVVVGGGVMASLTLSWAFASPLAQWINSGLLRGFTPLFRLIGRTPLLGRLPFFAASR